MVKLLFQVAILVLVFSISALGQNGSSLPKEKTIRHEDSPKLRSQLLSDLSVDIGLSGRYFFNVKDVAGSVVIKYDNKEGRYVANIEFPVRNVVRSSSGVTSHEYNFKYLQLEAIVAYLIPDNAAEGETDEEGITTFPEAGSSFSIVIGGDDYKNGTSARFIGRFNPDTQSMTGFMSGRVRRGSIEHEYRWHLVIRRSPEE